MLSDGCSTTTIPFQIYNFRPTFDCLISNYELLSPTCMHDAATFTFNGQVHPSIMHALTQVKIDRSLETSSERIVHTAEMQRAVKEKDIFKVYNSISCTREWEQNEAVILESIIRSRMDQIPFLYQVLMKKQNQLPILYATEFSHSLGCGANRHLARYHPPAAKAGKNLVGKIYDKIVEEKIDCPSRKRGNQSSLL